MSVAKELGLAHPEDAQLREARHRWAWWVSEDPKIGVVSDLLDLPAWVRAVSRVDSDRVLLALAELGAPDGADDLMAVAALTWALLPGATLLANRLRSLTVQIDEAVASQLWIEARMFGPGRSRHKVAANILMNTRKGVLRELGVGKHLERSDPTWARTTPLDPTSYDWWLVERAAAGNTHDERDHLGNFLLDAIESRVVGSRDCELLWTLAEECERQESNHSGQGSGGLMGVAVSEAVAERRGVSGRTVRRHGSHSLQALRHTCRPPDAIPA